MPKVKEENKEVIEPSEKKYNVVAYTDGSGLLEYRTWGLGFIAYSYEVKQGKPGDKDGYKPDKSLISKFNPTTLGFVSKDLIAEDEIYEHAIPVEVDKLYYGYKSGDIDNTNNFAEASATYEILKLLEEDVKNGYNLDKVFIKTDSQMVVMVFIDILTNPNFNPDKFAYPDLYKAIHGIVSSFKEKGITVTIKHVYGHSASFGNHIADRLAFTGRNIHTKRKIRGNSEYPLHSYIVSNVKDLTNEYNEKWNGPIMGLPFYRLFVPIINNDNINLFNVMEYAQDDKVLGTRDPNIPFGHIMEDREDEVVKTILQAPESNNLKDEFFHFMLQNINKPFTYLMLKLGNSVLTFKNKSLKLLDETDMAIMTEPSGLIRQQLDRYVKTDLALSTYNRFINKEKQVTKSEIIEVTDKFFEFKKDKLVCKIKHNEEDFTVETKLGTPTKHTVMFKSFLPKQKYFKDFESNKFKEVKCYFLTILVSTTTTKKGTTYLFDDYFIVDGISSEDKRHLSVWCNFYSGRTLNIT